MSSPVIARAPLWLVLFEPVRSAEPPSISGTAAHNAFSTCCDAARVATAAGFSTAERMKSSSDLRQPVGSSPASRRCNSAACSGYACA